MIPCDICGKMFERDECIGETCDECCAAPLTTEALRAEIERLKGDGMEYWEGKYQTLRLFYDELVAALGFIAADIGEPHEIHHEAAARAKQYRRWVMDCSLDNPEEWDD